MTTTTTYRRTDGKQIQFSEERPFLMVQWTDRLDMLSNLEPTDYIQEEWADRGNKYLSLIRFRTIRLGVNDPSWTEVVIVAA